MSTLEERIKGKQTLIESYKKSMANTTSVKRRKYYQKLIDRTASAIESLLSVKDVTPKSDTGNAASLDMIGLKDFWEAKTGQAYFMPVSLPKPESQAVKDFKAAWEEMSKNPTFFCAPAFPIIDMPDRHFANPGHVAPITLETVERVIRHIREGFEGFSLTHPEATATINWGEKSKEARIEDINKLIEAEKNSAREFRTMYGAASTPNMKEHWDHCLTSTRVKIKELEEELSDLKKEGAEKKLPDSQRYFNAQTKNKKEGSIEALEEELIKYQRALGAWEERIKLSDGNHETEYFSKKFKRVQEKIDIIEELLERAKQIEQIKIAKDKEKEALKEAEALNANIRPFKDKKIYIAGQISGLKPDLAKEKFTSAFDDLKNEGAYPINPFSVYLGKDATQKQYMRVVLPMLLEADAIYMLDNWRESEGARVELSLAIKCGMGIFGHITSLEVQAIRNAK